MKHPLKTTFFIILTLLIISPPWPAWANATVGSGSAASCTEAALDAALAQGGTITFNCGPEPHTITLSNTKRLSNGATLTMDGGGLITLSGGEAGGLFAVVDESRLTLRNLTLTQGNSADRGGAVYVESGTATLENLIVSDNTARYGGGLATRQNGTLIINNSTIENNTATDSGGGLHNREGTVTISNSTLRNNTAQTLNGGGIFYQYGGPLVVSGSTLAGNAAQHGGGIATTGSGSGGGLRLENSTLHGNSAGQGGALYNRTPDTVIINSTMANNTATDFFPGIENRGSGAAIRMQNTILANDALFDNPNCANRDGATLLNEGGNIQFPGDSCGAEILSAEPLLLPLADNGGPTESMALGAGSPALEGGMAENCPDVDQRGIARPQDGDGDGTATCDSGAFELEAGAEPPPASNIVGEGTPASCTEAALRAAINKSGTITFNCGPAPHTINISDDLRVTNDTVIDGGGPTQGGLITLSGGQQTRLFFVEEGINLTLQNITVAEGREPGPDGSGGGVFGNDKNRLTMINALFRDNDGTAGDQLNGGGAIFSGSFSTLVISQTAFINNRGINGGAINNLQSELLVVSSTFSNNENLRASGLELGYGGGAIYIDGASDNKDSSSGGHVIIRDSTFTGNRTAGQGGAIFSFLYTPDDTLIEGSSFVENIALPNDSGDEALGGAVFHGGAGPLTVRSSAFISNTARRQGGGLWAENRRPVTVTNVTFYGNRAVTSMETGAGGLGGALAGQGDLSCRNCTFAENHAGSKGGAIFTDGPLTLQNTLLVDNTAFNDGSGAAEFQSCDSSISNLFTDAGGNFQFPGKNPASQNDRNCTPEITIADPMLAPLADNGGGTRTMALPAGSPAVDAGVAASCPTTDQRGYLRVAGACDSGAFELAAQSPEPTLDELIYLPLILR